MARTKRSKEIVSALEASIMGVTEEVAQQPEPDPLRPVTQEEIALIVERVVSSADIDNDMIQKSVDEGVLLALDEMKHILRKGEPEERISAARVIVSIGNHSLARRRLVVNKKQRVHVTIGDKLTIKKSEQNVIGPAEE
jgi:hypothetical protein